MKTVVVVGGGFAGIAAARALQASGKVHVTLVDKKEYFEVTMAQLRALVQPDTIGSASRIAYSELFAGTFVQGEVSEVEDSAVRLVDGTKIAFDTVILAPGTRYPQFPLAKPLSQATITERNNFNWGEHQRFQEAAAYLVIGGGLVGVELAGELASFAPDKKVRLAHQGTRLAENLSEKSSAIALKHLQELGVEVLLGQANLQPRADEAVYTTVSPEPATKFLASRPGLLNARGQIQVDAYLRVKAVPGWYAVGDSNDVAEAKQATPAGAQGEYAAKAILAELANGPQKLKPYAHQPVLALVPIGAKHGFAQLPFGTVTWKFLVNMKRKDLLITMFRQRFGLKAAGK